MLRETVPKVSIIINFAAQDNRLLLFIVPAAVCHDVQAQHPLHNLIIPYIHVSYYGDICRQFDNLLTPLCFCR